MIAVESFCIGFLIGAVFAGLFFMLGVIYDRCIKDNSGGKLLDDNGVRVYIPNRLRDRCGNK